MIAIACPVVLHPAGVPRRHLILSHPMAGLQLVKSTVGPGEAPTGSAARELFESAGLETVAALPLGHSGAIQTGATWHFALCRLKPPVRETWHHLAPDDSRTRHTLSWIDLAAQWPDMQGHDARALAWITAELG